MGAGVMLMNFQGKALIRQLALGGLLPALVCLVVVLMLPRPPAAAPSTGPTTVPSQPEQTGYILSLLEGDGCVDVELETYLTGVVLAEMPASFASQALRAQAVAARTYTLKQCRSNQRHGKNTLCADHTCCQAYIDPKDYVARGGSWSSVERVRQAVESTAGQVLQYDGELIFATYFSCAGGQTEAAVAVWGQDFPYLQSVPSPGEEGATWFTDEKTFTSQQLQQALAVRLDGPVRSWFGDISYTDGGGVDWMEIGGVAYRGKTLRTLLGLRSTVFTVSFSGDSVTFHTRGYGHRVGLSQYGANAMALAGSTYPQILAHYYTGTELVHYSVMAE